MTRKVVLDTETTGLEVERGHRIIEIGCVELIDRRPSGREFRHYLNPARAIDAGAMAVHGISNEFLLDKPSFSAIADAFIAFIDGAELLIHNAAFDIAFLDAELKRVDRNLGRVSDYAAVTDTLAIAREKYPGQKNTLDALCKRFGVDNSRRELHGALLDAHLLAEVWLAMTAGQAVLSLGMEPTARPQTPAAAVAAESNGTPLRLRVLRASDEENAAHAKRLATIDHACATGNLWERQAQSSD